MRSLPAPDVIVFHTCSPNAQSLQKIMSSGSCCPSPHCVVSAALCVSAPDRWSGAGFCPCSRAAAMVDTPSLLEPCPPQ